MKPPEREAFQAASRAFQSGDLTEAERLFGDFVEHHPQSGLADDALYQLGLIYSMTQRKEKALETFSYVQKMFPGSDGARLARDQQDLKAEEGVLEGTQARDLFHRGRDLASQRQFTKARELLRACAEDHPFSDYADNALLSLATIAALEGKPREALGYLKTILVDYPDSDAAQSAPEAVRRIQQDLENE